MNESKVHEAFNGYKAYPLGTGERMIRSRLIDLFDRIINKNEICFKRAIAMGQEKLMSRILAVRKRMERMRSDMAHEDMVTEYKIEPLSGADETLLNEVDEKLASIISECLAGVESLTCMETDMHVSERFAAMDNSLREIERLFHRRRELFKKMRVYG